jgi:hypothetical protein
MSRLYFLYSLQNRLMKKLTILFAILCILQKAKAQNPAGKWKLLSHTIVFDGKQLDTHAALLQQKPCAADIIYEINEDGTFRLNAKLSGCDEKYKNIQEKLYSQTRWKLTGNLFSTSSTNFAVSQSYQISITGRKMTWTGTEGQGVLIFQRR